MTTVCPTCGDTNRVPHGRWDEEAEIYRTYWGPCPVCAGLTEPYAVALPGLSDDETRRLQFLRWRRQRDAARTEGGDA